MRRTSGRQALVLRRPSSGGVMRNSPGFLKLPGFLLASALLLLCQPAYAEKRVALVLANSAYQNVPQLPNPANDGALIAATLKEAGFDVVDSRHDMPALEMRRALRAPSGNARRAGHSASSFTPPPT